MKPYKGMRLERNGNGCVVHDVKDGQVYYQIWPKGVDDQSFFENLYRRPVEDFERQVLESDVVI